MLTGGPDFRERAPARLGSMPDSTTLLHAADRLADRFRAMPQGRLAELAPGGLALARRLAHRAQQLEGGAKHLELPEAGIFSVGDQIPTTAHDLVAALPPEPGEESARLLADSVAEV